MGPDLARRCRLHLMHDSCVVLLGLAGMDVDGSRGAGRDARTVRCRINSCRGVYAPTHDRRPGVDTSPVPAVHRRLAMEPASSRFDEFTAELRGEQKTLPTILAYQGSAAVPGLRVRSPLSVVGGVRADFGTQPARRERRFALPEANPRAALCQRFTIQLVCDNPGRLSRCERDGITRWMHSGMLC